MDREGTGFKDSDLVTIARLTTELRELFLGYRGHTDIAMFDLVKGDNRFEFLEELFLRERNIQGVGFECLVGWWETLRRVTVKRAFVGAGALEAAKCPAADQEVRRVEKPTVFTLFCNQHCDHFESKSLREVSQMDFPFSHG